VVQAQPDPRPDQPSAEAFGARGAGKQSPESGEAELSEAEVDVEVEIDPACVVTVLRQEIPGWVLPGARRLATETNHPLLTKAVAGSAGGELQSLNNALMDLFRQEHDRPAGVEAFTLLYELNVQPFAAIAGRILRLNGSRADVGDVLQEAFLAIYRYPSRFCPDKPNAFRNWSYSIIRNTVYRHSQAAARASLPSDLIAETLADERTAAPDDDAARSESDVTCRRVYGLLLCLYSRVYVEALKPRDREALRLVEVEGLGYREAAELLGVRLENFKMIVCRARNRIVHALQRVLGTQSP